MSVPILLVTGALGAGKTTLINRLLIEPQGRRLAAVVNDFGAIDIDAALLSGVADGVVSLKNGCICCSLQSDLLSTLSTLLRRSPPPEGIVIETSGVSNPAEIIQSLLDPVVWKSASLDAVLTVCDGRMLADRRDLSEDALWQAQLQAADYVALNKMDLLNPTERRKVSSMLRRHKSDRLVYEITEGRFPPELLFSAALHGPADVALKPQMMALPAFDTVSWSTSAPLMLERFQAVIGRFSSVLVRAKGLVLFADRPDSLALFQLAGSRATISKAPVNIPRDPAARLVFIDKAGTLDKKQLLHSLNDCQSAPQQDDAALMASAALSSETSQ